MPALQMEVCGLVMRCRLNVVFVRLLRQPTAHQLKALKGDPKQPGYAAQMSDLKAGQIVQVTLAAT